MPKILTYIFLFIALYIEIFFLITYFEFRKKEKSTKTKIFKKLPSVSVIVPVWNEEKTVLKTIFSLLNLNYPKNKLFIFIVDDGSTDKTWNVLQRFKNHKQIKIFKKENGGKYTALNHALKYIDTDLVGCLDADSFVHPEALQRIVSRFEDPEIMAVTPSIKVFEPKGFLGLIQKAEYILGIFLRKVLHNLDAIYITPGPLSIFRRSVFEKLGSYRHAHNTEDIEIAMRMQKNNMRISNAHNAYIYTVAPNNLKVLLKQRLRWVYGFIKNALDYKELFFKPQHSHLGLIVLPAAGFSIFATLYFFIMRIYSAIENMILKVKEIYTIGFHFNSFNIDLFYFNTSIIIFISMIAISGVFLTIMVSRYLAEEKTKFGFDSILFLIFYTFLSPIWMIWALYNLVTSKSSKWR
ncbi:MAG: glycosyltransferase family 2 protein [Candidatus Zambryskibacteria bacterium]|nr:glycosyltransferase family 2 protein [Candidatus Zambryskibacteria bacterium]